MHTFSATGARRALGLAALAAAAAVAALALAGPAAAKPTAYAGKSTGGFEITFKRSGNAVKNVRATIPTTCVSAFPGATAHAGSELYEPPARLPLGRHVRVTAQQDPILHYSDVTKNYHFTARKRRNGTITGRLHLNYSFQTVRYTYSLVLVGYVCQGDATFRARPVRG